jgi:hypothetical protein
LAFCEVRLTTFFKTGFPRPSVMPSHKTVAWLQPRFLSLEGKSGKGTTGVSELFQIFSFSD